MAFTSRPIEAGVDPSVGSVGDALDNALAETTVGIFKNERIWRGGPWRNVDNVEIETLNWVDWFNNERPHDCFDDLTPASRGPALSPQEHTGTRRATQKTESPDMPRGVTLLWAGAQRLGSPAQACARLRQSQLASGDRLRAFGQPNLRSGHPWAESGPANGPVRHNPRSET